MNERDLKVRTLPKTRLKGTRTAGWVLKEPDQGKWMSGSVVK